MGKSIKTIALELQPCCGKRSGIGTYTYEIAKRLKNDDEIRFCGNLFNFCGRNDNSQALQGIDMPITVRKILPYGVYRRIWDFLPITYDNIFMTHAELSIFFNYIVPPRIKSKVITTIHDMAYMRCPETIDEKNLKRLLDGMERSVKGSDKIITVSEFSKSEILHFLDVPQEKIVIVHNAPSFSDETIDFETIVSKYGVKRPYILYVGNIEPRKNIIRLIHAYEQLRVNEKINHQLVLAGGSGWQNEAIYSSAKESKFAEDIIFTGFISNSEKNSLYKNATVFVFPSIYEGFGIPPIEAMHFGCPVVASDAASLPEVCGEAAELVNPSDEEDIVRGIWHVISDKEYANSLIEKGYKQEKLFTWEASAQRLTEICKEELNK